MYIILWMVNVVIKMFFVCSNTFHNSCIEQGFSQMCNIIWLSILFICAKPSCNSCIDIRSPLIVSCDACQDFVTIISMYGFSTICFLKWMHKYIFSKICLLKWLPWSTLHAKVLPQWLHLYSFSHVCILTWLSKFYSMWWSWHNDSTNKVSLQCAA